MLLQVCLERLQPDTTKIPEIKNAIDEALETLVIQQQTVQLNGGDPLKISADRYWEPFRLALLPSQPVRVREIALDCVQKLIAHNVLRGALPGNLDQIPSPPAGQFTLLGRRFSLTALVKSNVEPLSIELTQQRIGQPLDEDVEKQLLKNTFLIDEIVHCIAHSLSGVSSHAEDAVQIQILKVLLTAVTSTECEVHERSLVKVLQTCFVIHSNAAKGSTNEVTAKAILTQMINLIFSRMERYADVLVHSTDSNDQLEKLNRTPTPESIKEIIVESELSQLKSPALSIDELKISMTETEGNQENNQGLESIEQGSVSGNHIQDESNEQPTEQGYVPPDFAENNPYTPSVAFYYQLLRKDVFLTLRFLCLMSMHSDSAVISSSPNKVGLVGDDISVACVKSRLLALELLLSVLNNVGRVLRTDDMYINQIRQHLCVSISKNAITTDPALFELSLSLFLLIIRHYRDKLKVEIEVLLSTVFIQILEMGNSTYKQKSIVLQGLLKICETPQTLVDLYMNYDCDMSMSSIFERLAGVCSKITQKRAETSATSSFGLVSYAVGLDSKNDLIKEQDRRLKLRGLCALVAMIQSLVAWSTDSSIPMSKVSSSQDKSNGAENNDSEERTSESTARTFVDALAPTTGSDSVLVVNRNPLHSVSMNDRHTSNSSLPILETDREDIQQVASRKQLLKKAIKMFNSKPKKGMSILVELKFVDNTPESIAEFLKNTAELQKPAIGEYLGEGDPFNVKVLRAFIDNMDFTGMDFVAALRYFLQSFRLPGEAQKIDRFMEKFADRYCENNPEVFAKADTAYTLAFSVMMLNTDQHSKSIKHRMDKAAFIKNNRGINDDADLPEQFLNAIFDEISSNEIIMEEEHTGKLAEITKGWGAGDLNDRQRMELYRKEVSMIQKKSHMLMKAGQSNRIVAPFRSGTRELAQPMFAMISWPLMATLSLFFEAAADDDLNNLFHESSPASKEPIVTDLCLKGFAGAIRLASIFKMETERDAFVSALSRLTSLSNFTAIKAKNIKATKVLVELAGQLGEYMETSWLQILKVLSQIEKLQVLVAHARESENAGKRAAKVENGLKLTPVLERFADEFVSQSSVIILDRIFTTTDKLSAPAIIHFFKALCQISLEEVGLNQPAGVFTQGPPRMYLLQKIVEVAHYNIRRIRYEWTQIWRILQPHFNAVACHSNQDVATFAVDSLRQLAMKFLEREELGHFSSQHEFVKIFETIVRQSTSISIKELILSSVSQMISAKASSIRSGWKSMFVVLVKVAQGDEKLAKTSFSVIQMVYRKYFDEVVSAGVFVEFVSSLAEFSLLRGDGPVHDELVMGSIQLLQSCTKSLIERGNSESGVIRPGSHRPSTTGPPPLPSQPTAIALAAPHTPRINNLPSQPYLQENGRVSEEHFYLSWFPILSAFSRVIIESDGVLVRTHTIETLFETLRTSGHFFEATYWKTIHRNILSPIFEDLCDPNDEQQSREANSVVLILGLRLLVDMISEHFDLLVSGSDDNGADSSSIEFLQSSLDMMVIMMGKKDDKLPLSGQLCFSQFLLKNVQKLAKLNSWEWLVEKIEKAFVITSPLELLNCEITPSKRPSVSGAPEMTPQEVTFSDAYNGTDNESIHRMTSEFRRHSSSKIIPFDEILESAREAASKFGPKIHLDQLDFDHTIIKCVTHLELIQTARQFCIFPIDIDGQKSVPVIGLIRHEDRAKILVCLRNSYLIARSFNSLSDLRHAILKKGWVTKLPNLVKQEALSFSVYLNLLFASYKYVGDSLPNEPLFESAPGGVAEVLVNESMDLLDRYIELLQEPQKNARDIDLWSPVVISIFKDLLSIESWWNHNSEVISEESHSSLRKHLPRYFKLAVRMVNANRADLRNVLQEFMEKVGVDLLRVQ